MISEVHAAFERYEEALRRHDVEALNSFFLRSADTVRYGIAEENYGWEAIAAYRRAAAPIHPERRLGRTVIVSISADVACISAEFTDAGIAGIGRQTQTWVRTDEGWRIAQAHVSTSAAEHR